MPTDTPRRDACKWGLRVVGGCFGRRRLVDWQAALAGHAECDPRADVQSESYLSAFVFPDAMREHLDATGSPKGYAGPCGSLWLWFDLDSPDDPQRALEGARRLCAGLVERYALADDELLAFFSGSKGFHVGLPMAVCGSPAASLTFHRTARAFAEATAQRLGVTIDAGVYDRVRLFRAPNSRHPRTGLRKRRLTFDELLGLSLEAIRKMAEAPEAFDVPTGAATHPQAVADWLEAAEAVEQADAATAERRAEGAPAKLNRATLEFIRDGALEGDRHRRLFSAAANLAEFATVEELVYALLTEPGLDAGLTPSDVRRQIGCGIEKGMVGIRGMKGDVPRQSPTSGTT